MSGEYGPRCVIVLQVVMSLYDWFWCSQSALRRVLHDSVSSLCLLGCSAPCLTPRCPRSGTLAATLRYSLSLTWQRFWFVLALWPGLRSLARPLMAASRLYIRPRLIKVFRALALSHHMLRVLQWWLSQPRQRAWCWWYLWQWCSFHSHARTSADHISLVLVFVIKYTSPRS